VQAAVKRLGHDAVADPARGDDEDFFGHGGRAFLCCAILYSEMEGRVYGLAVPCRLAWKTSLSALPLLSAVRNGGGRLKVKNI